MSVSESLKKRPDIQSKDHTSCLSLVIVRMVSAASWSAVDGYEHSNIEHIHYCTNYVL